MSSENQHKLREVVRKHLVALAAELSDFEQTTHARLVTAPGIEGVASDLVEAYRDPRGYTISNLAQGLEAFLKLENTPVFGGCIGHTAALLKVPFE